MAFKIRYADGSLFGRFGTLETALNYLWGYLEDGDTGEMTPVLVKDVIKANDAGWLISLDQPIVQV